jgi:hypothetical protein
MSWGGEAAPQTIVDFANSKLVDLGTDPVLVKAVKDGNTKGQSLDQIKDLDEKWKATAGIADAANIFVNFSDQLPITLKSLSWTTREPMSA